MKVSNQFLLTPNEITTCPDDFSLTVIGKYNLYSEKSLNVFVEKGDEFSVAVIGFCFDWRVPYANESEIILDLCRLKNLPHILEASSNLSGVYVLLVWKQNKLYVIPDACSLREVSYIHQNGKFFASSSVRLLSIQNLLAPETDHPVYGSADFSASKHWIGDETPFRKVKRLKPNHYLLIEQELLHVVRFFPVIKNVESSVEDVATNSSNILKGLFTALAGRGRVLMGLTAGWDSRVLLAASKDVRDSILYSIVERTSSYDYSISRKLAKTFDLNHATFRFCKNPSDFKFNYLNEWLPNFDSKNPILNLFEYFPKLLVINGVCGEIGRNFYGLNNSVDGELLAGLAGHSRNEYCIAYYQKWLDDNIAVFKQTGYKTLDMFYWEEVLANKAAKELSERNSINNINYPPFNCRILLTQILSTNPLDRETQNNKLYLEIIKRCWPQVLVHPINPDPKKRIISVLQKIGFYNTYRKIFPSGIFRNKNFNLRGIKLSFSSEKS